MEAVAEIKQLDQIEASPGRPTRWRRCRGGEASKKWHITGPTCQRGPDVRFGSLADILASPSNVRFTPEIGHLRKRAVCPLWANSGHRTDMHYGPRRTAEVENARSAESCMPASTNAPMTAMATAAMHAKTKTLMTHPRLFCD